MRRVLALIAAVILAAAIGGFLFAWSGLYNVAASAGHWPVTAWLLHTTMRNSVETHAMPLDAPPLEDVALVDRGAGHYETGCAPCHGAPGAPGNRIPNKMLPEPPYLPAAIDDWNPEQLFWIVKHGLKYTGMPAWPAAGRDDEVWAVTAFLLRLPGMDPETYAALAKGAGIAVPAPGGDLPVPEEPGELFTMAEATLFGACVRCHGLDGVGRPSGAFPRLDRQSPEYLHRALGEYASGLRPSGIMQPLAAALDDDQMARLARHYAGAASEEPPQAAEPDPKVLDLGIRIAAEGIPARQIAACSACHGLGERPDNPLYPALDGQYASYIALQLRLFKQGVRGGTPYADIMRPIVRNMTEAEIEAVSLYYASLPAPQAVEAAAASAGPDASATPPQ